MATKSLNDDPRTLTLEEARQLLAAEEGDLTHSGHIKVVRKYADGDNFQEGTRWIGAFSEQMRAGNKAAIDLVRGGFVGRGTIPEFIQRHRRGVVGREPDWGYTVDREVTKEKPLTDDEKALIAEAEALMVEWWNERKVLALFRDSVDDLLVDERAPLRLFVPRGLREQGEDGTMMIPQPQKGDERERMAQALRYLYLTATVPSAAGVFVSLDTMQPFSVFLYDRGGSAYAEVSYVEGEETVTRIVAAKGKQKKQEPNQPDEYRFKWGGQLPMHEMRRPCLIGPMCLTLQQKLDLAETMEARNLTAAGSPERWITNANPDGDWKEVVENGKTVKRFVPKPIPIGAGVTNWLSGHELEVVDPDTGQVKSRTMTTPGVMRLDPAPAEAFRDVKDQTYASMLTEVNQRHILMSGDATASAISRVQARADAANALLDTKGEVDPAIRWVLGTTLAAAAQFAGLAERYASLRPVANCQIDTGPLTPEEKQALLEEFKEGTLSRETTIALLRDVEDPDAELARIEEEEEESLPFQQQRADLLATLVTEAEVSYEAALEVAGYTEEQRGKMKQKDIEPPTGQDGNPNPFLGGNGNGQGQGQPNTQSAQPTTQGGGS